MQNSAQILKIILLLLMAAFAVLFPVALFAGLSYDTIAAVLLALLAVALVILYFDRGGRKGGET